VHRPAIYPGLADQTVFITGGGSSIGAAITAGFAGQKAKVAFVHIAETQSRAMCSQVERETGRTPLFIPCDIRNIKTLQAAIEQTRKSLGDVGVRVNNAANDDRHAVEKVTVKYWDERMALNLRPMFVLCRPSGAAADEAAWRRLDYKLRLDQLDGDAGRLSSLCHGQVRSSWADANARPRFRVV
jgi:NAD(P)-dependent dehydrogenase (short-subunit alcohol dehydrogenase family)